MKRRHFFKSISSAAGGLLLTSKLPASPDTASLEQLRTAPRRDQPFWELVKQQFPFEKSLTYLNTAGLGSSPLPVSRTVKQYMDKENAFPNPGHNKEDWIRIREKCAELLGPGVTHEEIALTSTATESINIILNGLPLKKGDEIITTTHEHVALHVPLLHLMRTRGIIVKSFDPDLQHGMNNLNHIQSLITPNTRLIFISHVTTTTGQIMPVKAIGKLARSKNIWFALDGAQALAHVPTDLKESSADFYAASGHKWLLGPKRTGILYVDRARLDILTPSTLGAYSTRSYNFDKREIELCPTAQRYEYGTQNDALFYGLETALDFHNAVGPAAAWKHNRYLTEMFVAGIEEIPDIELLSPREKNYRSAIVTIKTKKPSFYPVACQLTDKKIRVRPVNEANLDGIRASFHIYNNETDVKTLLEALRKALITP